MIPEPNLCGGCRLCCKLMDIEELPQKPHLGWCQHACESGCSIYPTRPPSCQTYKCLWLWSQDKVPPLPQDLRPDLCGVIMDVTGDGKAVVARGEMNRLGNKKIQVFLARMRANGITTIEVSGDHYRKARLGRGLTGSSVVLNSPYGREVIPVK
jgi:hypothetical protein